MRRLLLLSVFYIAVRNSAAICLLDELKAVEGKCLAANGGNRVMLEEFVKMKKITTEEGKCFSACLLQSCNFMDAAGNIIHGKHKEYAAAHAHNDPEVEQKFMNVYELCGSVKAEANICETAYNYMSCLKDNCNDCVWDMNKI